MRICIVADASSEHTYRLAEYLGSRKHEVHLISWKRPKSDLPANVRLHGLPRLKVPLIRELSWLMQTRSSIRKIAPDVVDGHYITVYGFIAAFSGFHPLVTTAWGSDLLIDPWRSMIWKFTAKYATRRADKVACLFPIDVGADKLAALKCDVSKVFTYSLGVDVDEFKPCDDRDSVRATLGLDPSSSIVITTRGLDPIYDVETLVRAIPIVTRRVPRTAFVILYRKGQQDMVDKLKTMLTGGEDVTFLGWMPRETIPRLLSAADIYVSTSLSDGASIALFEGMACELAPVVTDIPANRYWLKDGESGFLFKPGNHQDLADKIVLLLQNRQTRVLFGRRAREIAVTRVERKTQLARVEGIYRELAEGVSTAHGPTGH